MISTGVLICSEKSGDVSISKDTYFSVIEFCLRALEETEWTKNHDNLKAIYSLLKDQNERKERDLKVIIETIWMICSETFVDCKDYRNSEDIIRKIHELGFIDYEDKKATIRHGNGMYNCANVSLKEEYTRIEKDDYLYQLMILYISLWAADYDRAIYVLKEMNKITSKLGLIQEFSEEHNLLDSVFNFFCLGQEGIVFCENIWTEEDLAVFMQFAKPLMPISFKIAEKTRAVQKEHKMF